MQYTAADAIEMMRKGGVDLSRELSNAWASYQDCLDEIKQDGGTPNFDFAAFEVALREAVDAA